MITPSTAATLLRDATYLNPSIAWTIAFWYKPGATTSVGVRTAYRYGDDSGVAPYIAIASHADTDDLYLAVVSGGSVESATYVPTPSVSCYVVVTYDGAGLLTFSVAGVVIGTVASDLSTIVFTVTHDLIGGGYGDFSIAYARVWQALLSAPQLATESTSLTPVVTAGLLTDTPLQASIDLTAHNRTATIWRPTGVIVSDLADPLLTVIVAPPANTTPAGALAVTVDSAVFQDTLTAGTATTVWMKCTAIRDGMWGAQAFSSLVPGTLYHPAVRVYDGLVNAQSENIYLFGTSGVNAPIQFPVLAGHTYYFKNLLAGVGITPATLIFSVLELLALPVPAGSFGINDDAPTSDFSAISYPVAFLRRSDGYPINFSGAGPTDSQQGEGGDIFSDGTLLLTDDDDTGASVGIYLSTDVNPLQLITIVALPENSYYERVSVANGLFYVVAGNPADVGAARIITITKMGVIGPQSWDLPQTGIQALGVSPDGSTAYYTQSESNSTIRAYDLLNAVALPNFAASVAGFGCGKDIFVMNDGSVYQLYLRVAPRETYLYAYNADGSLRATLSFGTAVSGAYLDNRLCRAIEDGHLWAWIRSSETSGVDKMFRVRLSDLTIVETTEGACQQFEGGSSGVFPTINTPMRAGHSESCPFWTVRPSVTALRLTQLPVEAAYDYATLQPFVSGSGRNWLTPPPTE